MENNLFPTPHDVLAYPAPLTRAINDVKHHLQNQNLNFKPTYETSRYFHEMKLLLIESGWQLSKDAAGNWIIEPFRG